MTIPDRGDRQLCAYYYSFETTGNPHIDAILAAVAWAGKCYHHTDSWSDDRSNGEPSCVAEIQNAANNAAAAVDETLKSVPAPEQALKRLVEAAENVVPFLARHNLCMSLADAITAYRQHEAAIMEALAIAQNLDVPISDCQRAVHAAGVPAELEYQYKKRIAELTEALLRKREAL